MAERKGRKVKKIIITVVILTMIIDIVSSMIKEKPEDKEEKTHLLQMFCQVINSQMQQAYFSLPAFLEEEKTDGGLSEFVVREMESNFLIYGFSGEKGDDQKTEDDRMRELMQVKEGSDEDKKDIEEANLDYDENALHIEKSIIDEMQKENNKFLDESKKEQQSGEAAKAETDGDNESEAPEAEKQEGFRVPAYPVYTYDWSKDWGYEEIISNFYAIDNTTSLQEEYVSLEKLLYRDLSVKQAEGTEQEGPQILIYHTHSQEGFVDSVPGDSSTTIVGAGAKVADLLENEYGFRVLHHTGEYDVENRDYAYSNSLPAIEQLLAENPSIEVVIDLHRDAVNEGDKLVMDLQGRPTARFMFFNGMSYIRDKGSISYLENPHIEDNLALSFQAQVAANEYYPGIARRIYLKAYRYNMHLRPKSMLVELGAQTNTVEEIMNACDPLAHIIAIVLDENL